MLKSENPGVDLGGIPGYGWVRSTQRANKGKAPELSGKVRDGGRRRGPRVCLQGVDHPYTRQRPAVPIRRRLAELMCIPASIRSAEGREALDCLVRLYESDSEAYRPDLGTCLCRKSITTELHVYECMKKQQDFAEFCFFCNEWLHEAQAWEEHCHSHINQGDVPMEMVYVKIGKLFLPGYCPFCLEDDHRPAAERLVQFCKMSNWRTHIWEHRIQWQNRCPDRRRKEKFESQDAFIYHMHDLHRIPRELFWGRTKWKATPVQKNRLENVLDNGALYMECHTIMDM
ncbi:hypothetical protein PG995_004490 [Apiospora arundinis]